MKIISWSIINNEIDYLPDIIPFHLNWMDQMYFLDTGSTDGSLQFLQEYAKKDNRVIVEKYHKSYIPDYSVEWKEMKNPFPEIEVRNYALEQVEKLGENWLIQLDGDEIFLPSTKEIISLTEGYGKSIITLSTINPVEELNKHPKEQRMNKGNNLNIKLYQPQVLYDPHARIWKSNIKIRYALNPVFKNKQQFHCIPVKNSQHIYHASENLFLTNLCHFHLHWMYGKKVQNYFGKLGMNDKKEIAKKQKINFYSGLVPKEFWQKRKDWINE